MTAFVDEHRGARGVEPICRALRIAPSARYARLARRADPARASARSRRDAELRAEIRRVRAANSGVHGAREVWRQLGREGIAVARCAVERLMRDMGLRGVVRGRGTRTTVSNPAAPCPADRANRRFRAPAPNVLWPSGFTYAAAWQGFVHVAFATDAFARRIVGWRVSRTAHAGFVLDAPEQALHDRRPDDAAILHPPFGELRARGLTDDAWRRLGLPPTSTLDGLYVVLAATKAPRAACVVPNSFLFRTTRAEQLLKERVIRQDGLDTVVGLPREALGRHSGVQASMLLFRMNSELARGWQVLMVDAKHAAEADADGWHEPVARALRARDDSEISCTVSLEEIAQQDFNITVERDGLRQDVLGAPRL